MGEDFLVAVRHLGVVADVLRWKYHREVFFAERQRLREGDPSLWLVWERLGKFGKFGTEGTVGTSVI